MIIYKITNILNNKTYIGQTISSLESRFGSHKSRARCSKSHKSALHNAIKKYGEINFKIEEIDGANNITELNYKEWLHIHNENSMYPTGYNLKEGGYNSRHSLKTRERQSQVMKIKYNKEALDNARELSIEKMRKPVVFENSITGEKLYFKKIKDTSVMGNHKYINDLLTGRRPYGLYKGYWVYYQHDGGFIKKRKDSNKIELNIKIKVTNVITRDIQYFNCKKGVIENLGVSKHFLDKHLKSGLPFNNMIFKRSI